MKDNNEILATLTQCHENATQFKIHSKKEKKN